jgi:hypothetical protein
VDDDHRSNGCRNCWGASPVLWQARARSLAIDRKIARELQRIATQAQQYHGLLTGEYDAATRAAVEGLIGIENLEDRWPFGSDQIDPVALNFLQKAYPAKKPRSKTGVKKTTRKK